MGAGEETTPGAKHEEGEDRSTLLDVSGPGAGGHRAAPTDSIEPFGRYSELVKVGAGGMGLVYRAMDSEMGRPVAIKVMRERAPVASKETVRFLREARITGQLEHPNIPPVHEIGRTPRGRLYFSMKLVQGRSLAETLREEPAPGEAERARLHLLAAFLKVTDAIAYAHSRGVLHRDLKPANIMVGEFGEVLVMDWGLADARNAERGTRNREGGIEEGTDARLTVEGAVLGTPMYMSPEQARGELERLDSRSDVYSLGAVLYEILTRRQPFGPGDAREILARVALGELVPPSRRAPGAQVPRELEAVVQRAMALRPSERYSSAAALAADISAYLEGRTLVAARYTLAGRAIKWALRHKAATGVVLAAIVSTLAVSSTFLWRARADRLARIEEAVAESEILLARVSDHEDRESELDSHLGAASALERALSLAPGDESIRERRRDVGVRLGRIALASGDYTLARRTFLGLEVYGASRESILELLAEAADVETGEIRRREKRLREILAEIGRGLSRRTPSRDNPLLADFVDDASSFQDLQTVEILGDALDALARKAAVEGKAAIWDEAEESTAKFCSRVLGSLGVLFEEATLPLAAWLAVEAGQALARTRRPSAEAPLFAFRERFGGDSSAWLRIRPLLSRIQTPSEVEGSMSAEEFLLAGMRADERGDHREAIAFYDRAIELDPLSAMSFNNRGNAWSKLSELPRALEDYSRAIELDPRHVLAYHNRGTIRQAAGDLNGAIEDYDRALAIDPDLELALACRGSARLLQRDFERARRDATRALELDPDLLDAYRVRAMVRKETGDLAGSLADISRAIALEPSLSQSHMNRGTIQEALGHLDDALAAYSKSIELDPRNAKAYYNRAVLNHRRGEFDRAIADYTMAIELDPEFAPACNNRGGIFLEKGDIARALTDLERAVEIDPAYIEAARNLATALERSGDPSRAVAVLSRALESSPDAKDAWVRRASARYLAGDLPGAEEDLDRAIAIDPDDPDLFRQRGSLRLESRQYASALSDYSRYAELRPERAEAHFDRGLALAALGDREGALEAYSRAIQVEPGTLEATINRGALQGEMGDHPGAIDDYTRALEIAPENFMALNNRASERFTAGEFAAAADDYQRATTVAPDRWESWFGLGLTLEALERREEALRALERANGLAPLEQKPGIEKRLEGLGGR